MKSKSIYFVILYCSLNVFSWLIVTKAYPEDNEDIDVLSDSFGSSSNKLLKNEVNPNSKDSLVRNKRTIGFLRQLFPGLSQIIDRKIQQITRILFRVVGRLILRSGRPGGARADENSGGTSNDSANGDGKGGRRISITLPTYPPFQDEEENETETPKSEKENETVVSGSEQTAVQSNDTSNTTTAELNIADSNNNDTTSNISLTETTPQTTEPQEDSNTIKRVNRDVSEVLGETTLSLEDEIGSSSTTKRTGILSRLRDMRNKRSGSFGSNSSGNSGNFIFDLIRLVAGSGMTPEQDEELNAPREERNEDSTNDNDVNSSGSNSDDNYTAGIPGPLTRLFLLANRGISSLIDDLIRLCPDADPKCQQAVFSNSDTENLLKDR